MSLPEIFALEMRGRARELERSINRIVVIGSKAIARALTHEFTPVDTGQAISNWQGALGSPKTGTLPASPAGEYGSTAGAAAAIAERPIAAAIAGRQTGQDVWISNNLDYINDLNIGEISPRSDPPPDRTPYPRFAERAVQVGSATVSANARRIFK